MLRNLDIHPQENEKSEIVKRLEENTGKNSLDMHVGSDLMDITQKPQTTKAKINKWYYIRLKICAHERKQSTT